MCVCVLRLQTLRRDADGKILERSILGTLEDLAEPPQQATLMPSTSYTSVGRGGPPRQSSLRVLASVPSIPSIAEGMISLQSRQEAAESQHSSTVRYEAIEERLRRSQAVRTKELEDRERNMKAMLPHEKVKLLREERARVRWQETQKYVTMPFTTTAPREMHAVETVAHVPTWMCAVDVKPP